MNVFWIAYKIYLPWFPLSFLLGIFMLLKTPLVKESVLIHIAIYPAIYLINLPFTGKYRYYFNNRGYLSWKVFCITCLADLALFSLSIAILNPFLHA